MFLVTRSTSLGLGPLGGSLTFDYLDFSGDNIRTHMVWSRYGVRGLSRIVSPDLDQMELQSLEQSRVGTKWKMDTDHALERGRP